MTIYFVAASALPVSLLMFLQFRRMREPSVLARSTADLESAGHRSEDDAFAKNNETVAEDRTVGTTQQNSFADFGHGVGFHASRLSAWQSVRSRIAELRKGESRRIYLANEQLQYCVSSRAVSPDGWSVATERPRPDKRFTKTLDLLPLAALVTDSHRKIVFANAAAEKLFGYSPHELEAMVSDDLLPPLRLYAHVTACYKDLTPKDGDSRDSGDLVGRRKDGIEFPAEVTMNPVSPDGEPYTLTIVIDRTERYELLRNRQQLAHLARVSTLGELVGSLAHELNQPLTAILSNAQAAQRFLATQPLDLAEIRDILRDLVADNNRASEIIRKVRAYVKTGELEAVSLSIASVIRDAVLLVRSEAIARGIRVFVTIAPELPSMQGDKVQMQQLILNLLLNAFDASESCSSLDHDVTIEAILADADTVRVGVRDCGAGLSADTADKIFLPFFTSKRDGLGLGLSISRSIVEMHGGRIWAENNKDRGATFYFHERRDVNGIFGGRRRGRTPSADAPDTLRRLLR